MECLGPQCAAMLLDWLRNRAGEGGAEAAPAAPSARQGTLWTSAPYQDDAPSLRSPAEWAGAVEHLEYAVFRRYQKLAHPPSGNLAEQHDRGTRCSKMDRYLARLDEAGRLAIESTSGGKSSARGSVRGRRSRSICSGLQARRADAKLAQLHMLTPEGFEEFVGELFEALSFEVEVVGEAPATRGPTSASGGRTAGDRPVQVQQGQGRRRLAGVAEVPRHGPPHGEPQGLLRDDPDLLARRRAVRRRAPDRADRRPPPDRAGPRGRRPRRLTRARAGVVLTRLARGDVRGAWGRAERAPGGVGTASTVSMLFANRGASLPPAH